MLERTGLSWWLAMFGLEIYFDDSGTDGRTPVAVAACYVSSKEQWDRFVNNWDRVLTDEGFDVFHMAEFVAKPEAGHKPFCDWDTNKKLRVYSKLASILNTRIQKGFAFAIPKHSFDAYALKEFKEEYAKDHYSWAVKRILGLLAEWRKQSNITAPMQYVFDHGSLAEPQLKAIWEECKINAQAERKYGIVPDGVMFQDKKVFKPLQAADILAWQMQNHMRRTVLIGKDPDDARFRHPGFQVLLENNLTQAAFNTDDQLRATFAKMNEHKRQTGKWPWEATD